MKNVEKRNNTVLSSTLCISQFNLHPGPPPPPRPNPHTTPRLLRGICPPFQSRGWGICKISAARGLGICQPRGYSRAFDTRAVSYQNITTQRILLDKRRLAHLSRTGCCKDVFSILSLHFFIAYEARIS